MAKVAPVAAAASPDAAAPAKGSKKLIVILAILVVLLAGGGAGAYFVLLKPAGEHAEEEHKPAEPVGPPTFVVLDQFVVNLSDPDSSRYLQIGITYEVSNPATADEIKNFTPVIRSRILLVLSGKNVSTLTSIEGKQQLMDELVDLARVTIKGDEKDPTRGIRDVHFSSFVIQ